MAKKPTTVLGRAAATLGSYWLALAMLVNLFLLTWLGTLDQVNKGIYRVQQEYFESWWVVTEAPIWAGVEIPLVLLGGMPTMSLLTIGLVFGGLVRIRKTRRTIGVIIAHVGIAVMMLGGIVEFEQKQYGNLVLREGQRGSSYSDYEDRELVVWNTASNVGVEETIIPERDFDDLDGEQRRTFESDALPFDIVLSHYMHNAFPERAVGVGVPSAPVIESLFLKTVARADSPEAERRGVYVKVLKDGGTSMEQSFLLDIERRPFVFDAGGQTWAMMLRKEAFDLPFGIRMVDFVKDDHPGMSMARSYSSDVVRIDREGGETPVHIRMNEPMRSDGYIVYQSGYGPQDASGQLIGTPEETYSVFAISNNPSDRIPWIAVTIIAAGLVWTFVDRLIVFLAKQGRRREMVRKAGGASKSDMGAAA
ncbi:MAG: cytochrome c biogenesis protein ResB [Planctomycetota bacterium]